MNKQTCESCKWLYNEHCCNGQSYNCTELVFEDTSCEKWEGERMNIQEAIEQLKFDKELAKRDYISPTNHKEYDLAIEALEKQIPKKPTENLYFEQDGDGWYDEGETYSCPACEDDCEIGRYSKESSQWIFEIKKYCPDCGQAIKMDWSVEE